MPRLGLAASGTGRAALHRHHLEVMPTAIASGTTLVRQFRDAMLKEAAICERKLFSASVSFTNPCCSRPGRIRPLPTPSARLCHRPVPRQDQGYPSYPWTSASILHFRSGRPDKGRRRGNCHGHPSCDVIPPQRENGTAMTKATAEDSRKDAGNLRFEAVIQTNRQNHFTIIELWRDREAADAHSMTARYSRLPRETAAPASGALYDERFYKVFELPGPTACWSCPELRRKRSCCRWRTQPMEHGASPRVVSLRETDVKVERNHAEVAAETSSPGCCAKPSRQPQPRMLPARVYP